MYKSKLLVTALIVVILIGCGGNNRRIQEGTEETPASFVEEHPYGTAFFGICVAGLIVGAVAESPWLLFGLMGCGIGGVTFALSLAPEEVEITDPPEEVKRILDN